MGLFDVFSADDAQKAARDQAAGIQTGLTNATSAVNTGLNNATTQYGYAMQPWSTLAGTTNNAFTAYGNAAGANGAAGNAAAVANFQGSPGYQYTVNQAIQNADRGAAARGTLSSGGQQANELGIASNLANQNWGQYTSTLGNLAGMAPTVAAGQSGVSQNLGNLNYNAGTTLGNLNYTAATGVGNANAAGDMAPYQAAQNGWGAIFGGLNLGAKLLGGVGGASPSFGGGASFGNGTGAASPGQTGWSNMGTGGTMYPSF